MARRHAVRRIGQVLARTLLVAIGVLGSASMVAAQGGRTSVIHGVVTDDSDAAMPGVTVNLTSPALQVPLLSAVTGTDGTYRFGELPAGTFRVSFELAGFSNFVREDVRLTIGFTARIDAKMAIGTLTESVTVSGQSPVVDLTATGTAATFTNETLNEIPRGRDLWAVVEMAPGVSRAGAPDVGGSRMASAAGDGNLRRRGPAQARSRGHQHQHRRRRQLGGLPQLLRLRRDPVQDLGHRRRGRHAGHADDCGAALRQQRVPRPLRGLVPGAEAAEQQPHRRLARAGPDQHRAAQAPLRPGRRPRRPHHPQPAVVLRRRQQAEPGQQPARLRRESRSRQRLPDRRRAAGRLPQQPDPVQRQAVVADLAEQPADRRLPARPEAAGRIRRRAAAAARGDARLLPADLREEGRAAEHARARRCSSRR